jgi:hypothetical protein
MSWDHAMKIVTICCAFVLAAPHLGAGQRLALRVSPAVALAPAFVTVRIPIEPSDTNRMLNVEVDSSTYHRSSGIPLNGRNTPRVTVFEVKDLPTGLYEVRAVLVGSNGPIAHTLQLVKVEPAAGS